jgi:hypothetical protein
MYFNIETEAICCHPHFGQFLDLHQTLGDGGFKDLILPFKYITDITTNNRYCTVKLYAQ